MPNLYLGTIGWSYSFWKGKFYPKKTAAKDYLAYYASQFNTVEVDSTFYRIPMAPTVTNWKQQTPENFRFSLKFPQRITHMKMLRDSQGETDVFLDRVKLLGDKVGVLLMQFPPNFGVDHLADLEVYLGKLPAGYRYAVEVRNKSWLKPEFYSILRTNKAALAWSDRAIMAQISEVTSDFVYVRWEGDRKKVNGLLGKIEADRTSDLKSVADEINPYLSKMEVYGYFGKYYSGYPPSDVSLLSKLLV